MDEPRKGQRSVLDPALAARVRAAREQAGLTQEEAAKRIGVATIMIAGIEQKRKGVTLWVLRKMAQVYGRDFCWLLSGQAPAVPEATEELAHLVSVLTPEPKQTREQVVRRALQYLEDLKAARQGAP